MLTRKDILICLPTYNEAPSIKIMIDKIRKLNYDLIVTDGGSTDGTIEIATSEQVKILHRPGKGKGYGIKMALRYANQNGYKYLGVIDCDNTYPAEAFNGCENIINNNDIIIYCRNFKDITWHRRLINNILNLIFNKLFNSKFKDMTSGMRIFKVDKFDGHITIDEIYVEVEICIIIKKFGLKYLEKDIKYYPRLGNHKSNVIDVLKIFIYFFKQFPLK